MLRLVKFRQAATRAFGRPLPLEIEEINKAYMYRVRSDWQEKIAPPMMECATMVKAEGVE